MNKRNRSFLTILLCFIFLLNISPLSMFKPIRVMAADQLSLKVKDIEYYPGKGCGGFQNLNPSFGINYGEDGDVTCNGGTVTIEQNFDSLKDSFFYEDFLYGIRVSYNPATGVVTLTGKKPIHYYEMFMQGMMFKTTAESGSRKIIVSLNTDKLTVKAAINVSIIDETPPIVSVLGNPTTWTKGDVTLNVDAFDAIPGLDPKGAYSFDGGSSWTTSNSKSFSSNGIINIIVRDKAGNKAYKNVDINKIDKTAPTFSNITQTPTDWTTGVNLIVNKATDVGSGLHSTPYSFSTTQAGYYWQASNVSSAYSKNQTVYVYVMDALGNISNASTVDITKIDTTKPTVSTNDTNYSWRNKDFNVTIDYSDTGGSKVNTKEYAVTNSSETPSAWTSSEASKLISISSEGQWYIHYKVTDIAGNSNVGFYGPYKLDKTAPSGAISFQSDKTKDGNNYVRNQVVLMNLTGNDNVSSVSQMRFANSASDLTSAAWETFGPVRNGFKLSNDNGLKTVYFQLKDNADNISSVYSESIYFDDTKPKITISAPSKYVAQSSDVITYTVTFNDNSKDFGNSSVAQNQGIDSTNFGIDKIVLSKFGSIDTDKIIKTIEDVVNEPLKKLIKLRIPSDIKGEGSINLKIAASAATDEAGNLSDETDCSYAFSMDNVPSVNQNEIFKGDLRVKGGSDITLNDTSVNTGGLGSDSVRFAPANYNGTSVNTNTVTSTPGSSLDINAPLSEGEYYLYVVDSAGNISSASTHKIIVDNSGPIVTISEPSKTITKGDSKVEYLITFSDDANINSSFGESNIGFKTTGTANAKISIETVLGNDRQRKVKLSHFTGDGSIDSLVIAPDVARDSIENVSLQTIESTKIIVDNTMPTAPTINFTELNKGTINKILNFVTFKNFWNGVIEVKIQASDLGGSNLSKIYYKISESGSYKAVTPDAQGNITFELPVGFKGNVWIYSEDGSGNKSAIVESDGTISENNAPEIVVTPEVLSTWGREGVNINVKVTDNEGLKAIIYSVDGVETVIDMVSNYTDKQDNKEFTIPVAGDSKGHIVQINTVDLAGNNAATYNAVVKIDSALPTIASVTGNPSDWTKGSVTLTVNASDAVSGLAEKAYSFDGGQTWQSEKVKTYEENTNDIVVQVKDNAGNISTYDTINISKIDKTESNVAEVENALSYTENNWFKENQTITANFKTTPGCDERLQYKVDNADWIVGKSVGIDAEGKHDVSFRVIDDLGRASAVQTVKVNLDNTAPTSAKIKVKDKEFTSFLNTITFGVFFKETVNVEISADSNISGVNKIEYQKVSSESDYNANGKWTSASSFNVSPDEKFVVYAKVTDNAGNYVIINSDGVIVDATKPALAVTPDVNGWAAKDVNVKVVVSDKLAGVKEVAYSTDETVPQTGTVSVSNGEGTIVLTNQGQYNLTVTAKDNSLNEITKTAEIKMDKTLPVITSVTGNPSDWTKGSVTLTVNASNAVSGLAEKAYSFDGGQTWQSEKAKTYEENINGIVVQVKDNAGNISTYDTINISKIDKTESNVAEVENALSYTENNWFKENQTITANFKTTPGCDERLQYKVDNADWIVGKSVGIDAEGKHDVSFRVIDGLGRTSAEQTVKVNLDNTAPTSAKIKVKDKEFTSFLNTITFGVFFKETVNVEISADSNISGVNKIEYQKVSSEADYNPNGKWTSGSSFNVSPDEKFVVYAKVTDNAGNYVIINSDGVIVDATTPSLAVTPDVNGWAAKDVNVKVVVSDKLAGVKEVAYSTDETVPQTGTVSVSNGEGTIVLTNQGQYKLTVTAKDNSFNQISESANIKIDKTKPIITGASNSLSYFIGRVINLTDAFGEIADATYKNATATETSFKDGYLFEKAGKYTLTLRDKAGNLDSLSFEINALPKVEDVLYKADCKALIDSIRAEFDKHNDLPEPYKTDTDNKIKALEGRYSQLDKEVTEIKTETSVINGKVDKLPNGVDGLLHLKKQIQDKYNKIASITSTLTTEQKIALEKEAEYLKQQLSIIETMQNQINNTKTQVSNIDTKDEGLISREGKIRGLLSDMEKLAKEQQSILQSQIDLLNRLLDKITTLKEQIQNLKGMINSLPAVDKITKQDAENITKVNQLHNDFTNEQNKLIGENLIKLLNDVTDVLNKLMLHDEKTDITITGMDGTSFASDVYLVVTPIKVDGASTAKFSSASVSVKRASKNISQLKGKELLALYDVSLFRDNIKIQPNGKVKVKIKIPDNLISSKGLDIVHIADDGSVTPMNATVEDGYLIFITTHFSDYAIVGKAITKEIPKTGSPIDSYSLISIGMLFLLTGLFCVRKKRA